jgi:hypothetical protein
MDLSRDFNPNKRSRNNSIDLEKAYNVNKRSRNSSLKNKIDLVKDFN